MPEPFYPGLRPALIGSLPMKDHQEATRLVLTHVPEIPLWVQLPMYEAEGMVSQFLPGFPGARRLSGKQFIDSRDPSFDEEAIGFYEDYLAVSENGPENGSENGVDLPASRFALDQDTARGFFTFLEQAAPRADSLFAVKGQITGPFTFAVSLTDADERAVFYDDQLRDIAVKLIAMKAGWQARRLAELGRPVMIFLDEPGLTAFGSSAFVSVSRRAVEDCFDEVIQAVKAAGALSGVHVCANADWSIILESAADIVSFDAYSYFDKFMLYPDQIREFMKQGKILAWGIVPTGDVEAVHRETAASLVDRWQVQARQVEALGIDRAVIAAQSLITPSCGTGALDYDSAERVLKLTAEVSALLRQ